MEFRILGPLEVIGDAGPIDVGGSRQRTLLAMLLVDANRVVSADRLVDGLWGEGPPRRATAGLQVLVSNLRRVLEPDRPARTDPRVLVTRPPGYLLVVEEAKLDASRFQSLLERGQRLLAEDRPAAARAAFDEALALWRGPALAEFAYDDFARSEAARLQMLRTVALEERVEADLRLGRHGAAVAEVEHLLGEYPLRERLWGLLMLGYYRAGRQADALRAFQQARERLADELGIVPSPVLQQLEADVLAQAPSLDWRPPAAEAVVAEAPPAAAVADDGAGAATTLVGRADELRRLRAALDQAAAGRGRLALVSGEPGVGKTRLVEELAASAEAGDALVAWGRCAPGDSAPPFWPWVDVLRTIAAATATDGGAAPGAVAQLVPELRPQPPEPVPPASDPAHARFQLCHDLTAYLRDAARSRCVVVVLDDLHWADPPSVELLTILTSRLDGARLLVVGTYRDVDVDLDHPLVAALGSLTRQTPVVRLALTGISPEECGRFIAGATGAEPTPELVAAVHARTDGNPFFMTELLRLLESEGPVTGGDHEAALHGAVPVGVRDVIAQRFSQLTPTARGVLTVAAVAGRELDHALLDAASEVGEDEVLAAVEQAIARGILVESPERVGGYRFSHALIRDTIYAATSGLRRARMHARIGEALEQLPAGSGETRVAELAYHFRNAVPAAGVGPALRYSMAAAGAAAAQLAYERAEDQLRRALVMVPALPEPERAPAELAALVRLGTLLAATRGQAAPEVEAAFSRARQLCPRVEAGRDAITALWGFFYSAYVGGRLDDARAVAGDLLAMAGESRVPELLLAGQLAMGIVSFHEGRLAAARAHLSAGVELADGAADRSLTEVFQVDPRVYARCFHALVLALSGESGEVVAGEARDIAAEGPQPFSMATAAMFSAWLGFLGDDPEAVGEHARATADLAEEHGFPLLAGAGTAFAGWALARQGDPEAGAARVAAGLAPFRGDGRTAQPLFMALEAEVEHLAGRAEPALALVEQALAAGAGTAGEEAEAGHYFDAALHRLRAEILLDAFPERSAEAEAALRRSVAFAAAHGATAMERRASRLLAAL